MMIDRKWNLNNIPPIGHPDVAEFALQLFEIARAEKERLGKPEEFHENYAMYRGRPLESVVTSARKGYSQQTTNITPVNLLFANINRTVANITARESAGEVVDLDGIKDDVEIALSSQLKKWWQETHQQEKTQDAALQMEIYGPTIEKPGYDQKRREPTILVVDPFQFFPAPGYWEDVSIHAPYVAYVFLSFVSAIEREYGVKDVASDDAYELLGLSREETGGTAGIPLGNYADGVTVSRQDETPVDGKTTQRGIIIEVWIRDGGTETKTTAQPMTDETGTIVSDPQTGYPIMVQTKVTAPRCPDGIRCIMITKSTSPDAKCGYVVLQDTPNPNINMKHVEQGNRVEKTHPWGRIPCYVRSSYKDGFSVWGFSAAEQVGDLLRKINIILSKMINYAVNVMAPPLIIQQHCGITREMIEKSINSAGRMVLMPTIPNARIEFMQIPNLPSTIFNVLDLMFRMFDRVYQIEDADRGVAPTGVVAASAIVALQERNQMLMQSKTRAIDAIAEERSRWAIGLWQNWGTSREIVDLNGEKAALLPARLVGRRFSFVVEAGSTTPRTSLQDQERAIALADKGHIDRRALLETLNFPNWKAIIERIGENELDGALHVLIAAGLPVNQAVALKKFLMETQGGPGDTRQAHPGEEGNPPMKQPQAGVPKAKQGGRVAA